MARRLWHDQDGVKGVVLRLSRTKCTVGVATWDLESTMGPDRKDCRWLAPLARRIRH